MKSMPQRKVYFDVLRIIAAFFVILHHTPSLTLYQHSDGVKAWVYGGLSSFTMLNTPIFFMISGALLLKREESIRHILKHRVLKYIAVIFLINYAMYWAYGYPSLKLGFFDFFPRALKGNIDGVYWFLYAYLAFLLLLPFLQKAVKGMSWGHFWLLLILRFVVATLLPVLNYFLGETAGFAFHSSLDVTFANDRWIFFPVIGYFLDQNVDLEQKKPHHILAVAGLGFLGIFATTAIMLYEGATTGFSVKFIQIFDYLTAISVFLVVKYFFVRMETEKLQNSGLGKVLSGIGGLTFGIYLMDPIWRKMFFAKFSGELDLWLPTVVVCVLWCVCSMTVSGIFTAILKKVPLVRRLL